MIDGNETQCAGHFTMYTNVKSPYCTHDTNIKLSLILQFLKRQKTVKMATASPSLSVITLSKNRLNPSNERHKVAE